MTWEETRKEIQFWLDFSQVDISKMPVEKKGALIFKIHALFGLREGDAGNIEEKIFKVYEQGFGDLQRALSKYFEQILALQKSPTTSYFDLPKIKRFAAVFDNQLMPTLNTVDSILFDEATQKFYIEPGVLVLRVFDLMIGRSPNIVKKCVVCQKLFCHLPKKNKLYCSSPCRWRASQRRYRARKST